VSEVIRLNTSISDGNRIFFQVYLPCAIRKSEYPMYVIVNYVHCIPVKRCWIALNEM
jgi:hypothetical protein